MSLLTWAPAGPCGQRHGVLVAPAPAAAGAPTQAVSADDVSVTESINVPDAASPWERNLAHSPWTRGRQTARPDADDPSSPLSTASAGESDAPAFDEPASPRTPPPRRAPRDGRTPPRPPSDEWGHFRSMSSADLLDRAAAPPADAATPEYIVEEPLESQVLWHGTAGRRPPQPRHEREFFEDLYEKRLAASAPELRQPAAAPRPPGTERVRWRERVVWGGESAHRSWRCAGCSEVTTMSLSLTKLQVTDGRWRGRAEFLVVAKIGAVRFGIWRTFSDFQKLAATLRAVDDRVHRLSGMMPVFGNTDRSWKCVRRRQHFCRNLDRGYLTEKAFLLERFLHDALYEAPVSEVFSDFLEIGDGPAAPPAPAVSFGSTRDHGGRRPRLDRA